MTSTAAKVPPVAARYFAPSRAHPIVAQVYRPGIGWKTLSSTKRVSGHWVRQAHADGITLVALRANGRTADFTIAELLRSMT